jgi:IS30 family transposase
MSKPYLRCYGYYDRLDKLKNRVSIGNRLLVVDRQYRTDDWEGDTIVCKNIAKNRQSTLLTLVKKKTLYTIIVKISSNKADALTDSIIESVPLIVDRFKTLTLYSG